MSDQHRTRGTWLRLLAECMFDRSTLERVISPALADLQHECATSAGGASRQWIWCRAYWGVWKTLGVCLMDATLRDPSPLDVARRRGVRRMLRRATFARVEYKVGGEEGIRTPGSLPASTVFKTAALNHSATSPPGYYCIPLRSRQSSAVSVVGPSRRVDSPNR
jgi:hypothetical protein